MNIDRKAGKTQKKILTPAVYDTPEQNLASFDWDLADGF